MSSSTYTPPEVWTWEKANGGKYASVNRPTAGAQFEQVLPVGERPFQLYSRGTPNGQKVTIMFEELLEAGVKEAPSTSARATSSAAASWRSTPTPRFRRWSIAAVRSR